MTVLARCENKSAARSTSSRAASRTWLTICSVSCELNLRFWVQTPAAARALAGQTHRVLRLGGAWRWPTSIAPVGPFPPSQAAGSLGIGIPTRRRGVLELHRSTSARRRREVDTVVTSGTGRPRLGRTWSVSSSARAVSVSAATVPSRPENSAGITSLVARPSPICSSADRYSMVRTLLSASASLMPVRRARAAAPSPIPIFSSRSSVGLGPQLDGACIALGVEDRCRLVDPPPRGWPPASRRRPGR